MFLLPTLVLASCAVPSHSVDVQVQDSRFKSVDFDQFIYLCYQCIGGTRTTYNSVTGGKCTCKGTWCGAVEQRENEEQFRKNILIAHNYYRGLHEAGPLVYNVSLENYARKYMESYVAKHPVFEHNPDLGSMGYGENQFQSNVDSVDAVPGSKAVTAWYSEVNEEGYDADNTTIERLNQKPQIGHFTQLVWKGTKSVGCVRGLNANGHLNILCNYHPGGNVLVRKGGVLTNEALLKNIQSRTDGCTGPQCICMNGTYVPSPTEDAPTAATQPTTPACNTQAVQLDRVEAGPQKWTEFMEANDEPNTWDDNFYDLAPERPLEVGDKITIVANKTTFQNFSITFWPYLEKTLWRLTPVFRVGGAMDLSKFGMYKGEMNFGEQHHSRQCFEITAEIFGKSIYKIGIANSDCSKTVGPTVKLELNVLDNRKPKYIQFKNVDVIRGMHETPCR